MQQSRLKPPLPSSVFAGDLAPYVADGASEIGLQLAKCLARPLELLGVRIALVPLQRQLADPQIALAQVEPNALASRTSRSRAR